jgi:multicomponent K+:H+ antiporter subunit A
VNPLLPLLALLPFAGVLLLALPDDRRRTAAALAGAVALACCALVALAAPAVFAGEVLRWQVTWVEPLGLAFGFRMDGLAWLFTLLVCGIGALIVLYAAWYLDPADPAPRFFAFLLLFMGAMLGLVLADNLLLLVVFWELTSLSSFLFIGYWQHRADAREGAKMALAVTGAGGLALLGGVLLLGQIVGSFQLDAVLAAGETIRASPLYLPALLLVLAGAFAKSAQFPLHFWLPQAMAAPTPVSAYLHSATMVKAGVFLLARLFPALGGSEAWFWIVSLTGLATLLAGAYIAIFQQDLKGLLAYSTVSHLGLITLLFGLSSPLAVVAGVFHIINHAIFKASLFMAAGIIDHETGSRDLRRLGGLWRCMPITATLAMVAAASMAGVPLANGFLSKEMFFAETVSLRTTPVFSVALPLGAALAGVFSVAYSARFVHDVFFNGSPAGLPKVPHEPPRLMRVPVELLVLLCLAVGLLPALTVGPTLAVAARATLFGGPYGELPQYTLALWHGINLPLVMSLVALCGGAALYFGLQRFVDLHRVERLPGWIAAGGREAFAALIGGKLVLARRITGLMQSGRLQNYLALLVIMALAAGALPYFTRAGVALLGPAPQVAAPGDLVVVMALGIVCALATVLAYRQRLLALVLLGAVGLVVSLVFAYLSAPDLALTQLLVEVVSIIAMALALNWLPPTSPPERGRLRQGVDALLAVAGGAGIAALAYAVLQRPYDSIAPYFLETAVSEGGGSNVVNVILVDYRGFDTLGEISVLGIAAVIICALLAGFQPPGPAPLPGNAHERHPPLLGVVVRALLPLTALVSVYFFLRGHNLPGGGFIAGLVLAIGLILLYVAHGADWMQARLRVDFRTWIGAGLLVAAATGVASFAFGAPFLTSSYVYLPLPLIGPVPLASAALFDLGVYLTVVGATLVALEAVARLRVRES